MPKLVQTLIDANINISKKDNGVNKNSMQKEKVAKNIKNNKEKFSLDDVKFSLNEAHIKASKRYNYSKYCD